MQNYIGKQIDRYRILAQQGMGGMAVVYRAYDARLERDVAIKVIRTESIPPEQVERLMKRFEFEAKAQAQFSHPHIVPVYDYGDVGGSPYLVMEYIAGGTLKDKLGKPVPYTQAIRWLAPIADALSYAHQLGVVHRDVKPSNILFTTHGRPILTDFGIAKILERTDVKLTGAGLGVGTPEYMAPEQWQGQAGQASDQYALGVVLYELLTSQKPFTAETPVAVALKQMNEPMQQPSELVAGIPANVERVLYKALSSLPQDRFADMHAFHQALLDLERDLEPVPTEMKAAWRADAVEQDPDPTIDKVGTERKTVDFLDSSPYSNASVKKSFQNDTSKDGKRQSIPRWTLWVGLIVLLVCLVVLGVTAALMGTDLLRTKRESPSLTGLQVQGEATEQPAGVIRERSDPTHIEYTQESFETEAVSSQAQPDTPTDYSTAPSIYLTPTPEQYRPLSGCAASHLHVGDSAFVSYEGGKNRIRSEPDASQDNKIAEIQPGEVVLIIDGPECSYGLIMWKVETTRAERGWTPESNGEEFWLLPLTTRALCEGALPSRLVVGDKAKVNEVPPDSNLLRTGPSRFDEVIGKIRPGNWMQVLEGPVCGEKTHWWRVEDLITGTVGWTMEGSLAYYYLSPEP